MISATILRRPDGEFAGYRISGHAGFADAGQDIVCAAVSCLAINTANSLQELTEDPVSAEEADGLLTVRLKAGCSEKSKLLMDSLVLGLSSIREEYGKEYLKLGFKEV